MLKVMCQRCGKGFEAKRKDAKWCKECQRLVKREHDRANQKDYRARRPDRYNICPLCGKPKYYKAKLCLGCHREKFMFQKGEKNLSWRGGKSMHSAGYVQIRKPPDYKGGGKHNYILEHRYLWERTYGPIPKGVILHHLNGDKTDNRLENLCALRRNEHDPKLILEPFRKRINELEAQVRKLTRGVE